MGQVDQPLGQRMVSPETNSKEPETFGVDSKQKKPLICIPIAITKCARITCTWTPP